MTNKWEDIVGAEPYSVRCIDNIFEKVVPTLSQEGEFPAQTLRRVFLEGVFAPTDLNKISGVGPKASRSLLLALGLAATTDGRFIQSS